MRVGRRSFLKLSLLLLLPGRVPRWEPRAVSDGARPNILILLFDAFSARHISLYGYPRQTTPNLARFAARATVYHAHYAGGNYTVPGTACLLTGTYPWSHRAFHIAGKVTDGMVRRSVFRVFSEQGYRAMGYTPNLLANVLLDQLLRDLGVHLDAGRFCVADERLGGRLFARDGSTAFRGLERSALDTKKIPGTPLLPYLLALRREAIGARLGTEYSALYPRGLPGYENWLRFTLEDGIDGIPAVISRAGQPFLAYFHLLPPHYPYRPRREFASLFDDGWKPVRKKLHFFSQGLSQKDLNRRRREYDQFIAHVDAEFGRLYDYLAEKGTLDNTYLIVTSDHGEMFERGIWKHDTPILYEPVIRIPLLISGPGQTHREDVYSPTSAVDLLPTLCQVVGQPIPEWCEGTVLPGFASQPASSSERSIWVVEAKQNAQHAPLTNATVALIKGRYKLVHYFGYAGYQDEYELYDLQSDPEELRNLYSAQTAVAAELRAELLDKLRQVNQPYMG